MNDMARLHSLTSNNEHGLWRLSAILYILKVHFKLLLIVRYIHDDHEFRAQIYNKYNIFFKLVMNRFSIKSLMS